MIISIEKLRELVPSVKDKSDEELRAKIGALETFIRKYTNNNFQQRNFRTVGSIRNGLLIADMSLFKNGDNYEISKSKYNDGVYVFEVGAEAPELYDEENVLITKVVYPQDVVMGAVNLFKWDVENRGKIGVKSESLSRYSVTYYDMESGGNSVGGYPKGLVSFLTPYMKAKF